MDISLTVDQAFLDRHNFSMGKITNYDEDPVFELEDVLTEHEGSYETSPGGVCLN